MDIANPFELKKISKKSKARLGVIHTFHGDVHTPVFMPVGTNATVKGISNYDLEKMGAEMILANTYHLFLRPGTKLISESHGVQKFMGFNKPMLTDSGGFQVYSLKQFRKITENGVKFKSYLDGKEHFFTPASVMKAEREIGADIIMAFDECTPYPCTKEIANESLELTLKWTEEAKLWLNMNPPIHGYPQYFFGIVQGGMYKDLRKKSIEKLIQIAPDGYAMGGLSVGESTKLMYEITDFCTDFLPKNRARYVMGVGTPWNLLELIKLGVDMFDCVLPMKNAQDGLVYTSNGILRFKGAKYAHMHDTPFDINCSCYCCKNYSRAYLRHLFKAKEPLCWTLAAIHNLHFYLDLMKNARAHIELGDFEEWSYEMIIRIKKNAD